MPYLLLPPRRPLSSSWPDRVSDPPKPKYATDDRAVAQVFYSYGWIVMHVANLHSENESAVCWDSDSDEDGDNETTRSDDISCIRHCFGISELHHPGVVLGELSEGPQVEEQVKWIVMWVADWDMDREVDLKIVL